MKYSQQSLYPGDNYDNYERETIHLFSNIVQSNWITFDCGAKTGYFTLLFSELCENGKVHSFEPTSTYTMLKYNVEYYNLTNVILNNKALGETSGNIQESIYRIWGNPPENQIYNFTTIDNYCIENKIDKIDLIKIDVDSYDFETLKGSINTLKKLNPIVTVELNHALNLRNSNPDEVINWLNSIGYKNKYITDNENYTFYFQQ